VNIGVFHFSYRETSVLLYVEEDEGGLIIYTDVSKSARLSLGAGSRCAGWNLHIN